MKKLSILWDEFWFAPCSPVNCRLMTFFIFSLGTTWLFFMGPSPYVGEGLAWDPISFFQLLEGPIESYNLSILRYMWLFTGLSAGIGFLFRYTGPVCALSAIFFLGYPQNFGSVSHSTHLYVLAVSILSFSRFISELSYLNRWPVQAIKLLVVWELFLSGCQKLYYGNGLDWAFSDSFFLRLVATPQQLLLTEWLISGPLILTQMSAAYVHFIIQLSSPFSFLNQKIAIFYVLNWSLFNILVSLTIGGHYQFYVQLACYTAFVDWEYLLRRFKFFWLLKKLL